jgi:hypothetical protein
MAPESRRKFLTRAGLVACGFAGGIRAVTAAASRPQEIVTARGCRFLCEQQSADGAWRSQQYGAFRQGDALTPLVVCALQESLQRDAVLQNAIARGVAWLRALANERINNGEPWRKLAYPLFSAAFATQVFATAQDDTTMRFWLTIVKALRIRASLGWPRSSPVNGAWGDAVEPPQALAGGSGGTAQTPDMIAPNISATLLALDALTAAAEKSTAPGALPFIQRCQNFSETSASLFDDGGFFYAMDDAVRNKAGIAGIDDSGRERYRSYGSATCDGILALRAAGSRSDDPRCVAALRWLAREMHDAVNAGNWPVERQDAREALVYYHAQALARVLAFADAAGAVDRMWINAQRDALRSTLEKRQRPDGSWSGAQPDSCEDDPIVATSFALRALASQDAKRSAPGSAGILPVEAGILPGP